MALEGLTSTARTNPDVIDLRLRICANLGKWDMGDNLAAVLQFADEEQDGSDRFNITCAQYQQGRAQALLAEGDTAGAEERATLAGELWALV